MWDEHLNCLQEFRIASFSNGPSTTRAIHSIGTNEAGNRVVCGIMSGEIIEISLESGKSVSLLESHLPGNLNFVALQPAAEVFKDTHGVSYATAAEDGWLKVINVF